MNKKLISMAGIAALGWSAAIAQDGPKDGGIGMLPANSAVAEEVHFFHNVVLMPVITIISIFVLALLIWVVIRYNTKANPNPRKFSHNTLVEIIWTGVPILILLYIALFSFDLLYKEDVIPDGRQMIAEGDGATTEYAFANLFPARRMVKRVSHLQVLVGEGDNQRQLKPRRDFSVDGLGDAEVIVKFNEAPAAGEPVVIRGGRSIVGRGDRQRNRYGSVHDFESERLPMGMDIFLP